MVSNVWKRGSKSLRIKLLAFGLLTAAAMASCQRHVNLPDDTVSVEPSATVDCQTVEHEKGTTEICGQPQRIVALSPYVLELLLAIDVQPVGYAAMFDFHQGDYSAPSQQIPYLGDRITPPLANVGLAETPSIEAILKVQPDLILGTDIVNSSHYEMLSQLAPTLLLEYADTAKGLRAIAQAVDRTEQAEQLLMQTHQQIATAREALSPFVATYPQVTLVHPLLNLETVYLYNSKSHCGSLTEAIGFELVFPPGISKNDPNRSTPISIETLPQLNEADLVILLGDNFDNIKQLDDMDRFEDHQLSTLKQVWKKNAIAQSLNASQARRVYFIPAYICGLLPGPIGTEIYLNQLKQQLLSTQSAETIDCVRSDSLPSLH